MNRETALITGSSSGIGLHLAHEFARHGHPLVLVAPVLSELENVAADIQSKHNVSVDVIAKNLKNDECGGGNLCRPRRPRDKNRHPRQQHRSGFRGNSWEMPTSRRFPWYD